MSTLNNSQRSQLKALAQKSGLWRGVEPYEADADLRVFLREHLVEHLGPGRGYSITEAGRAALSQGEKP